MIFENGLGLFVSRVCAWFLQPCADFAHESVSLLSECAMVLRLVVSESLTSRLVSSCVGDVCERCTRSRFWRKWYDRMLTSLSEILSVGDGLV